MQCRRVRSVCGAGMTETNEPVRHDHTGVDQLKRQFDGKRAQVYCTNGSRLTGTVTFMHDKWVMVSRNGSQSALVNLEYVISMALENA